MGYIDFAGCFFLLAYSSKIMAFSSSVQLGLHFLFSVMLLLSITLKIFYRCSCKVRFAVRYVYILRWKSKYGNRSLHYRALPETTMKRLV